MPLLAAAAASASGPYGRSAWTPSTSRSSTSVGSTIRSNSEQTQEFNSPLGPINALAEATTGFVWRLVDEKGQSSSYVRLPGEDDPLMIVNMSVWKDLDSLKHFMYKSGHASYLRRRIEWFERSAEATSVCWWIRGGEIPDLADAHRRLMHLREHGPTSVSWPVNSPARPEE